MKKNINNFSSIINVRFKDDSLLRKSLTHKSYDKINNNEILEFLGDRVLGLIISKYLMSKFPDDKEGVLDKKFANLVNKKTCGKVGKKLNLRNFMFLGDSYKKADKSDEKIISDCLEALIGAIYIDQGFKLCEKFVETHWNEHLNKSFQLFVDPKTKLQEYCLKKFKKLPKYSIQNRAGPQHNPIFKVEVEIPESKKISANGNSIKIAQQNAAKKLIKVLRIK